MRHQSKQRLASHHYRNMELHTKLRDKVRYQDQYQSTRRRTLGLIDRFLDNKYTINSNKIWYTRYHRISQELSIGMVIPDRSSDNAIITSRFTDRKENESQAKEVHVITTCSTQRKHQHCYVSPQPCPTSSIAFQPRRPTCTRVPSTSLFGNRTPKTLTLIECRGRTHCGLHSTRRNYCDSISPISRSSFHTS
jgi:hypothetical protein